MGLFTGTSVNGTQDACYRGDFYCREGKRFPLLLPDKECVGEKAFNAGVCFEASIVSTVNELVNLSLKVGISTLSVSSKISPKKLCFFLTIAGRSG